MTKPDFRAERDLRARGFWPVAGIDEAGRGPLAGPVAAAAVILDPGKLPRGLNDSKQLSPGERDRLYDEILLHASAVAVAFARDRKSTRLNSSHCTPSRMPPSA